MDEIDRRDLPGNDASWYRALVAERADQTAAGDDADGAAIAVAVEASGELAAQPDGADLPDELTAEARSEPADLDSAEPPTEPETPPEAPGSSEDDEPKDSAVTTPEVKAAPPLVEDDSPIENTSEMVGQMWTAEDSAGPLDDWKPDDMNRKINSSRSFRWPTVIGALAVVALIAVGLVLLPSLTQSRADDHLTMITDALRDLRGELPDTQTSLSVATDPVSEVDELSALTTQLTELAAKASALDQATQADLPSAPPLTSSAPIDEIEPIRQRAEPLGTIALTIQRRISNLVEYRTLMSDFLALPPLPNTADSATQAELRVELASAQASSASTLAQLPSDVSLEDHKALARETLEGFATWQVDYLEALRNQDSAAADALIAELESDLTALDEALITPLAQIRRQTDADLIDLARDIDEVVAMADAINGSG